MEPDEVLASIRRSLLLILWLGTAGLGAELLLIGHLEGPWQLAPVVLLALGLVTLGWLAVAPGVPAIRALQLLMALFVVSGAIGVGLHYQGNEEFEREMYPTLEGLDLVRQTLTGATPVLAPGSMALVGLVGLAMTYRHPALSGRARRGLKETM
jgi:hypothetical protein